MIKDTTGAAPDIAKRVAQELVTRDNVDILAGLEKQESTAVEQAVSRLSVM